MTDLKRKPEVDAQRRPDEVVMLPEGTKIIFLRTIEDGPNDYSPGNHYATKGDYGTVTGHGCREGHWVKWEHWPHPFGAVLGEDFEAA